MCPAQSSSAIASCAAACGREIHSSKVCRSILLHACPTCSAGTIWQPMAPWSYRPAPHLTQILRTDYLRAKAKNRWPHRSAVFFWRQFLVQHDHIVAMHHFWLTSIAQQLLHFRRGMLAQQARFRTGVVGKTTGNFVALGIAYGDHIAT